MLFALITSANEIREYRDLPSAPPALPQTKGLRWLPVSGDEPTFDPATQKRSGPMVTVGATEVTRAWAVTNKTAAEIDAEKDAQAVGEIDGLKALRALVRWVAPLVGKTPAQARSELIAIYKSLP